MDKIIINAVGSRKTFEEWIKHRGGVRVWINCNMSNPAAGNIYTPEFNEYGNLNESPRWSHPKRGELVTDISRFKFVKAWKEVKRIRIAVRQSGHMLKLTDGSTNRLDSACAEFPGSSYHFEDDEAVISLPEYEEE